MLFQLAYKNTCTLNSVLAQLHQDHLRTERSGKLPTSFASYLRVRCCKELARTADHRGLRA